MRSMLIQSDSSSIGLPTLILQEAEQLSLGARQLPAPATTHLGSVSPVPPTGDVTFVCVINVPKVSGLVQCDYRSTSQRHEVTILRIMTGTRIWQ